MSDSDFRRLENMTCYAIDLQRAIEAHCRGRLADETKCPYHSKMLNDRLRQTQGFISELIDVKK